MLKKVLVSALALGALASMVGAGAYAAFTNEGTATGTFNTATIDLLLNGVNDATVTFAPQSLLPEESSSAPVNVGNNSNRDGHVSWTTQVTGGTGACPISNVTVAVTFADAAGDDHNPASGGIHIADGVTDVATITATLADVGNDCQNITFTVTVNFTLTGVADFPS